MADTFLAKRKRPPLRHAKDEKPPGVRGRGAVRLAGEPLLKRGRQPDRWEPGFLRMKGLPEGRSLSYVVDAVGIYYDATAPSELEYLLENGGWEDDALLRRAEAAMAALVASGLSLDDDPRRVALGDVLAGDGGTPSGRVVVIDQPRDDPAIGFALAGPSRFEAMLAYAATENDGEEIVVVMDPASRRQAVEGHLLAGGPRPGVRLVAEPVSAASVVAAARRLYTVGAHVGFEAAQAGRPVTCFGAPFYAGWGFTDDRLATLRRTRRRSVAEVFAAAYLVYSRYFEPYRGAPVVFEEALAIAAVAAERARENGVRTVCVGIADWKWTWTRHALKAPGFDPLISRRRNWQAADLAGTPRVVGWASRAPDGMERLCEEAEVPYVRMEDGFIRSIGLGASLKAGGSYVLDRAGMYYDASRPSDLETMLERADFDEGLLARARRFREAIVAAGISKYNVGGAPMPHLADATRPVVLVAGQVANDAAIRLGACTVEGNLGLLKEARRRHPDATVVYKPHPDVEAGLRPGRIPPRVLERHCDLVIRDVPAPAAIDAADRVFVATSLMGFEALLRGKQVTTCGLPFYAGWGLTDDPGSPRRTRRLTLDQLVAGALLLYPRYLDPQTGIACTPEAVLARLADGDPGLGRRTRSVKALLKEVWSAAFRRSTLRS